MFKNILHKSTPWVVLFMLLVTPLVFEPRVLEVMRVKAFDVYQTVWPRVSPDLPVYVIDVDEASLSEYGQWPWSRALVAKLIDKTFEQGVASMGLDVVFAESDATSPEQVIKNWTLPEDAAQAVRALPANDDVLAETVSKYNVVMGYTLSQGNLTGDKTTDTSESTLDAPQASTVIVTPSAKGWLFEAPALVRNVAVLEQADVKHGWFGYQPLLDNVIRSVPLAVSYNGQALLSLSMESLRMAMDSEHWQAGVSKKTSRIMTRKGFTGASLFQIGDFKIRTSEFGHYWLRFRPFDKTKYISAQAILAGEVIPELKGSIVLLGFSAMGLHDVRTTPLDAAVPGVELHIQLIENILEGHNLVRYIDDIYVELLWILVAGIIMITALERMGALAGILSGISVVSIVTTFAFYQFYMYERLYDWSYPLLALLGLALAHNTMRYLKESSSRKAIRSAFAHYLSPSLVNIVAQNPEKLVLGGEERNMSILFSDIRDFTSLSETLTPMQLSSLLNRYLTPMTELVQDSDGTIDKYIGDAVMAFWNAPLDVPNHPKKACETAINMIKSLETLNMTFEKEGVKPLRIGLGVHVGNVSVGNMGSEQRFDYTVMGDNVNLTARLEGLSKMYGVSIVVSAAIVEALPEGTFMPLDKVAVKGKSIPVNIFELVCMGVPTTDQQEDVNNMKSGLKAYYDRRFEDAEAHFTRLHAHDTLKALYLERTAHFRRRAPRDGWDGAFYATSK